MSYYGDIRLGDTIDIKFTTRQISGAPHTLAGTPVISAYVGNGTTQITAGITLTVDFDGVTGLNNVRVVATGGNGFATATNVELVITTGTVNSVSVVGEVIGSFSIENRSPVMPTTAGRTLTIESDGMAHADVKEWLGTAPATPTVAGVPEVDVTHNNGTAITAAAGRQEVNVSHFGGTSGTFASGRPEVNTSHIGGSAIAQAAGIAQVNVTQVGGSATPVTNLTTVFSTDFAANYNTTLDQWNVNLESWNATAVPAEHTAGYPIVTIKDGTGTGEIDTVSGKVLLGNGAHGGVAATLALRQVTVDNDITGAAVTLQSIDAQGLKIVAATGDAMLVQSGAGNGNAVRLTHHGTGFGLNGTINGNITGSLSGSVGSIGAGGIVAATFGAGAIDAAAIANGAIDGATFASGALDGVWSVTTRTLTAGTNIILAKGVGITGFNDLSAAQVNTEVDTALSDINLDHLVKIAVDTDFPTTVHLDSVLGHLADNGTTATFARSTDSLEAIRDRGDIAWITGGGSGGSGAFAITVTVNDGAVALQNVSVAIYDAGVSVASGTTNASGQVTFSLNAGTYTVALTKGGYSFTPVTRTVTGNQAGTLVNALSMTVNAGITPPADPSRCVVAGYLKDLNGNALVGAVLKVRLVPALANRPITASGNVVTFVSDEAISDAAGLVSIELIRTDVMTPSGCTYTFTCTDAGLDERNVVLAQATLDLANL